MRYSRNSSNILKTSVVFDFPLKIVSSILGYLDFIEPPRSNFGVWNGLNWPWRTPIATFSYPTFQSPEDVPYLHFSVGLSWSIWRFPYMGDPQKWWFNMVYSETSHLDGWFGGYHHLWKHHETESYPHNFPMEHVHGWYVEYLVGGFIQDGSPILPILSNLTASSVETHLSGPHPMSCLPKSL